MVELPFKPYPHQREAHGFRLAFRWLVLVWHRRAGKTVFAVMELVLAALCFRGQRGRFGYICPLLRQAKEVSWAYLREFTAPIPGCKYNEAELSVTLPGGHVIRLYGADNPDSMRGVYFDGVVLDEIAQMKPSLWGEILRPALADRQGWALFIGTPKGTNLFSELYYRSLKEAGWKGDLRRAQDTGVIVPEELEKARREMTPAQWAQEMECDFGASVDNVLVPFQVALDATRRKLQDVEFGQDPRVLGVDVARYGDDRSVAFLRQGRAAFKPKVWRSLDLMTLAGHVAQIIDQERPDAVFVDQTGIGSGVVDRLRQLGRRVIGIDFGGKPLDERFQNRRAEMWWLLGDWVKTASLPGDVPELVGELTAPTYSYANAAGKLQLESKEKLKARGLPSPDLADALALTFAHPVAAPGLRGRLPMVKRACGSARGR